MAAGPSQPAWPRGCGHASIESRCAAPVASTPLHSEWHSLLHGARCAVHRSSSSTSIGKRSGSIGAPIFGIKWLGSRLEQVSPCERPWPDSAPESFHRLRSNIFEVCVLFERAHSLEPAHIHSTALACCAQCTSCEALVCARSPLGVGGLRRHGDHQSDLHGGGPCVGAWDPKLRSGTYKPKKYVLFFLNSCDTRWYAACVCAGT